MRRYWFLLDEGGTVDSRPDLRLIAEITHCPDVAAVWSDAGSHPCRSIVETQPPNPSGFQVPEPWAGHLPEAPVLMISSNPSISEVEPYPTWSEPTAERAEFFDHRFGDGPMQVKDGVRHPLIKANDDGTWHSRRKVAFWRDCKANVEYVLGRPAEPGVDYVMTEVVHCKSRQEIGVATAVKHCADRWLERILALSPATLVVVLGDTARTVISQRLGADLPVWSLVRGRLGGQERTILSVRHPNFFGPRRWADHISGNDLVRLRQVLSVDSATSGPGQDEDLRWDSRAETIPTPESNEPKDAHTPAADHNPAEEQVGASTSPGAFAVSHPVTPDVDDILSRLSQHLGFLPIDVAADVVVIFDTTGRRAIARAYGSTIELLPTDLTGPGLSHKVRFVDCHQLVESSDRDRLVVQLLRLHYAPEAVADGPLTIHDLIDAYLQESRFLSGPEDMQEYWHSRASALADLLGFTETSGGAPISDGLDYSTAHGMIDSTQRSLHRAHSPMSEYLEAPPRLVEVTRPHGQVFSELEERWAEQSKAMLCDLLCAYEPLIDSRIVLAGRLRELGVADSPPRDQLMLDMDGWF